LKGVKFLAVSILAVFGFVVASTAGAYDGSLPDDTQQIGDVTMTNPSNHTMQIKTRFEKTAKTYNITLQPECYVMKATGKNKGQFSHFADLKTGTLVAVYGWMKDGKWMARRIDILDPNDYLVKRLAADAKAGVYYKSEQVAD